MTRLDHDDDEIEASRAPLMDHLIELRGRLMICVAAFVLGFIGCFIVADPIYVFLVQPFAVAAQFREAAGPNGAVSPFDLILGTAGIVPVPGGDGKTVNLIFTAPLEFLITKMKLAAFGAVVVTFPVLAWQLYLIAAPLLFLLGAALVYYVMLPFVMLFSLGQQISGGGITAELLPRVSDYLNLVMALLLAFGLCFQLPVVMTLLGLAGLISSRALASSRKYAVVAIAVVAAFVTPPDPLSQIMLGIPLVLLYEISIWCVRLIELRRREADAADGLT